MKVSMRKAIIDETRAASLVGLPQEQLRQICETSGLGHLDSGKSDAHWVLTYEELYRLCRLVVGPAS
jgi:hypothetical protein